MRHLYDAAVAQHGGTAPASVRLTHPAIWGRPRIDQLRRAAAEAGLPEVELLTEPVAAAMAYAHAHAVPNGTFLAVYDLGGGTFDAAVAQATAEGFVVVGRPVGEDRLGGELFDELLANAVAEQLEPSVRRRCSCPTRPPGCRPPPPCGPSAVGPRRR
ncbi:MAG: Hsp70 family protein [Acidimicrobiales bacterium]